RQFRPLDADEAEHGVSGRLARHAVAIEVAGHARTGSRDVHPALLLPHGASDGSPGSLPQALALPPRSRAIGLSLRSITPPGRVGGTGRTLSPDHLVRSWWRRDRWRPLRCR